MSTPELRKAWRFGPFEVDLQRRELRKHGIRIKLQEKPFQILAILLERPGETVSRAELRRKLWPEEQFGEFDQSLNTAIKKLRQALSDSASSPRYIETQARFGYRFVAPLQVIERDFVVASPQTPASTHSLVSNQSLPGWVALAAVLVTAVILQRAHISRGNGPGAVHSNGEIRSIAVLPLINLTSGGDHDYFADGLTDALITKLSRMGSLRVISRTSAMHYKETRKLLPEIGRELKVDAIVEGAVQHFGQRVHASIKLLRVATEQNLWTEVYESDMENIFSLENEIASAIAARIGARINPAEHLQFSRSRRLDPQAYEAYLKGRFFWNMRSADGLRRAVGYFNRALTTDPAYPLAYAGLADCYNLLSFYGVAKPSDSFPKAKAAATKALALDENIAEAHAALGYARLHFDWDWQGADAEFRKSLELNPGYANAHHWRSHYLLAVGRTDEAFAAATRALELDPLNQSINAHLGHHFIHVERYDEAIAQLKATLEMSPASARSHAWLGRALEGKRMFGKAKAEFREAIRLSGDDQQLKAELAHVYAAEGDSDEARKLLAKLEQHESAGEYISPYAIASVHAALGDHDRAFDYLARAYDLRQEELIYIKTDPNLKPLRSDPRFADLLRRIQLPL